MWWVRVFPEGSCFLHGAAPQVVLAQKDIEAAKLRKSIQDILGYREGDFSLREGTAVLEELSSGSGCLGGPVVGLFKYRKTPEGTELKGARIQPHSEVCADGLPSSMGPGLIVRSVCGVGRGVWGYICVRAVFRASSCGLWLGISEPFVF